MVGVTLLAEARAAGLDVRAEAARLIVRGPTAAEVIAGRLLDNKPTVLAELEVEAATAALDTVKARLAPINAHLLALFDAGDHAEAESLHAEIVDQVDTAWLPAVKRLGLALYRVDRLPAEDLPLIANELAAAQCIYGDGPLAEAERLYCVAHRPVPGVSGCIFCHEELDGGSRLLCVGCGSTPKKRRQP